MPDMWAPLAEPLAAPVRVAPSPPVRLRALPTAISLATLVVIGALALWLEADGPVGARVDVISASLLVTPLMAAAACTWRAVRSPEDRRAWFLLGLSAATWAGGSVAFAVYELGLQQTPPFPSVADALFLAFAIPAVVALVHLTWNVPRLASRARTLLDGLVIASALLFISWATVLGPIYRAESPSTWARLTGLAYPVVDVTVAALVLALGARREVRSRAAFWLIGAGLLVLSVSDSVYVEQNLVGSFEPGRGFYQAGYPLAFLLMTFGALSRCRDDDLPESRLRVHFIDDILTYAPLLGALLVAGTKSISPATDAFLFWSGLAVLLLAGARQLLVLVDNAQLRTQLEREVERRTQELRLSQSRLRAVTETAPDAIIVIDGEGRIRAWNSGATRLLGCEREQAVGRTMEDFMPVRYRHRHNQALLRHRTDAAEPFVGRVVELSALRTDGREVPVELALAGWEHDGESFFTGIMRDISDRRASERAAEAERASGRLLEQVAGAANAARDIEQALRETLAVVTRHGGWSLGHAFLVAEDGTLESGVWHRATGSRYDEFIELSESLGFTRGLGLPGLVVERGTPQWQMPMVADVAYPRAAKAAEVGLVSGCAFPILSRDDVVGVVELFNTRAVAEDPSLLELMRHVGTQLGRVVERERSERRLTQMALHDPLTGLANRLLFSDRLEQAVLRARRRHDRPVTVLLLDLDGFKGVNDSLGHAAGDQLLTQVAERLSRTCRGADSIARLGGDEFAVAVTDARDAADLGALAGRILTALDEPVLVQGRPLTIGASIGIAQGVDSAMTPEELLRNADLAMYSAKAAGRARYAFFDPSMHAATLRQLELESDLRAAVAEGHLEVHYQPIVDTASGAVVSREALVRWHHPERGWVPPADFIPVAETSGMIDAVGRFVLHQAARDAAGWRAAGESNVALAVNVSAREVRPELVETVRRELEDSGLPASALDLEITESLIVDLDVATATCLHDLHTLGVRVSIDDFGTGQSSLGRLRSLPVHEFKIDRSFVVDVTRDPAAAAMVEAIIAMARALECDVVAEGVETPEQLEFLVTRGCVRVQGYLLGRPAPRDSLGPASVDVAGLLGSVASAARPYAGLPEPEPDLDSVVRPLLDTLQRITGLDSTYLTRIHWDRQLQEIVLAHNAGDLDVPEGMFVDWSDTLCRQALLGRPSITTDVSSAYEPSTAAEALGLRSYVSVPVLGADGEVVGTLCGASRTERPQPPSTLAVLRMFARLIATHLDPDSADQLEPARP